MRLWVQEEVKQLLGEDEPSLVEFILDSLSKLSKRDGGDPTSEPGDRKSKVVADLEPMLVDETGPFVDALWTVLVKSTNTHERRDVK